MIAGSQTPLDGATAMSIPFWMLLGFTTWTMLLLIAFVGVYRWWNILFRNAGIASFSSDRLEGEDWYRRGTRAHLNCVENLPLFGAIVFMITAIGLAGPVVNGLCIAVLVARVCQSLVHVAHVQTNALVTVRFSFFSVQLICSLALIVMIVLYGA